MDLPFDEEPAEEETPSEPEQEEEKPAVTEDSSESDASEEKPKVEEPAPEEKKADQEEETPAEPQKETPPANEPPAAEENTPADPQKAQTPAEGSSDANGANTPAVTEPDTSGEEEGDSGNQEETSEPDDQEPEEDQPIELKLNSNEAIDPEDDADFVLTIPGGKEFGLIITSSKSFKISLQKDDEDPEKDLEADRNPAKDGYTFANLLDEGTWTISLTKRDASVRVRVLSESDYEAELEKSAKAAATNPADVKQQLHESADGTDEETTGSNDVVNKIETIIEDKKLDQADASETNPDGTEGEEGTETAGEDEGDPALTDEATLTGDGTEEEQSDTEEDEIASIAELTKDDFTADQLSQSDTDALVAQYITKTAVQSGRRNIKKVNSLNLAAAAPAGNDLPEGTQNRTGYTAFNIDLTNEEKEAEQYIVPVKLDEGIQLTRDRETFEKADYVLIHILDLETGETEEIVPEVEEEDGVVTGFTFTTDGFSTYILKYTVDFHYNGIDYSIPGESQILLSDLIEKLNIMNGDSQLDVNDVAMIEFTDLHLVTVEQVSGLITYNNEENVNVGAKNFLLSSINPFSTNEILTIELVDGSTIHVDVTDATLAKYQIYLSENQDSCGIRDVFSSEANLGLELLESILSNYDCAPYIQSSDGQYSYDYHTMIESNELTISGLKAIPSEDFIFLRFYDWSTTSWVKNSEDATIVIYFIAPKKAPEIVVNDGIFVYKITNEEAKIQGLVEPDNYIGTENITILGEAVIKDDETGEEQTYPVTGILKNAFIMEERIKTITFANTDVIEVEGTSINSIPNLTSISGDGPIKFTGASAISQNDMLESIEINVEGSAVGGISANQSLKNINMTINTTSGMYLYNGFFSDCPAIENLEIHGKVTAIMGDSLAQMDAIKSIVIDSPVPTELQSNALSDSSTLETVEFKGALSKIYYGALMNDTALKSFKVGASSGASLAIDERAFYADALLETFDLGSTVVSSIGYAAFEQAGLKGDVSFNVDDVTISGHAFFNMPNIEGLTFNGNVASFESNALGSWGTNDKNPNLTKVIVTGRTQNVKQNAFYGLPKLAAAVFKGGVESFGTEVFGGGTMDPSTASKTFVYVGDNGGTTTFDQYVVWPNRTSNAHVYFNMPSSRVIDEKSAIPYHVAAYYTDSLPEHIYVDLDTTEEDATQNGSIEHPFSDFGKVKALVSSFGATGDVSTKELFTADKAEAGITMELPYEATENNAYTLHIKSSNSNIEIPDYAFSQDGKLKSIRINAKDKDFKAGYCSFAACTNLEEIIFEEEIWNVEFDEYSFLSSALKELDIPYRGNVDIDNGAFVYNSNLTSVRLHEAIGNKKNLRHGMIGYAAFGNCSALTSFESDIQFYRSEDGTRGIESLAFSNDTNLEKVIFYGSADIKSSAFNGCTGLKTVRVDQPGVNGYQIATEAFPTDLADASFVINGDTANIYTDTFANLNGFTTLVLSGKQGKSGWYSIPASDTIETVYISADYRTKNLETRLSGLTNLQDLYIAQKRDDVENADDIIAALPNTNVHFLDDYEIIGLYLSGQGDDDGDGSRENPVKTFDRLKELINDFSEKEPLVETDEKLNGILSEIYRDAGVEKEIETFTKTITYDTTAYILDTVTISSGTSEDWSSDSEAIVINRDPSFAGVMVRNEGTLNLKNVVLDGGSEKGLTATGAIIYSSGTLNIEDDAKIINNNRTEFGYPDKAGGIYASGSVNMTGGEIYGNSGVYGGGIEICGSGSVFNMSGGSIHDNTTSGEGNHGGGVLVGSGATMNMSGTAKVIDNEATDGSLISGQGGGISIGADVSGMSGQARLYMTGGTIDGNTSAECGGGIFVQTNCTATISSGRITNNTSNGGEYGGGGIYANGVRDDTQDGKLYITGKALITDNSARTTGGGYAGCCTSTAYIYMGNGAALFGNSSGDPRTFHKIYPRAQHRASEAS